MKTIKMLTLTAVCLLASTLSAHEVVTPQDIQKQDSVAETTPKNAKPTVDPKAEKKAAEEAKKKAEAEKKKAEAEKKAAEEAKKKAEEEQKKAIAEQERKKIEELKKALKTTEQNVKPLKESISEKNLAKLQAQKQKLDEQLQKAANERTKKFNELTKDCSATSPTYKADSTRLAVLNDSLKRFNDFQQFRIDELIKDVDAKWLSKLFSQIDLAELQQECKRYKELVAANPNDKKLTDANYKIQMLLKQKQLFDAGKKAVESSYVAQTVKDLTPRVKALRDELTNADKKKEVARIFSQLYNYRATLMIFQDLINDLEKQKNFEGMKKVIEKQEEEDEVRSSIEAIAWLKSQYDQFYQDLQSGIRPKDAGSAILKLKP